MRRRTCRLSGHAHGDPSQPDTFGHAGKGRYLLVVTAVWSAVQRGTNEAQHPIAVID